MKFQTGRIRVSATKQIEFMIEKASEVQVKPSHRHTAAGWSGGHFQPCCKSKLKEFLKTADKSLRVDVVANEIGELVSFKAYRTHWSDVFFGKF